MAKVLLNKGSRTYDLKPGKDEKGNAVKRRLPPGQSIETLDDEEAKQLLDNHDIVDADKVVPQHAEKVEALEARVTELEASNAALVERLAKYEPETTTENEGDDESEEKGSGKKGGRRK